jgi:hypothetical protein
MNIMSFLHLFKLRVLDCLLLQFRKDEEGIIFEPVRHSLRVNGWARVCFILEQLVPRQEALYKLGCWYRFRLS